MNINYDNMLLPFSSGFRYDGQKSDGAISVDFKQWGIDNPVSMY